MASRDPERDQAPQEPEKTAVIPAASGTDPVPADGGEGAESPDSGVAAAYATNARVQEPLDLWSDVTPGELDVPTIDDAPSPEDAYAGDGPFAVPMDRPPTSAVQFAGAPPPDLLSPSTEDRLRTEDQLRTEDRPGIDDLTPPGDRPAAGTPDSFATSAFRVRRPASMNIKRKKPRSKRAQADAPSPRHSGARSSPRSVAPARHYPKMWALLDDPEAARAADRKAQTGGPPPVPGTFFPAATRRPDKPQVADLDQMLFAMAEGLLVGETADGHAEVRVTLRDEFFAGTELRLTCSPEGLSAVLAPPDRETFWLISGNRSELEARLTDRGLKLKSIEVREP